jgi:hypothetical protein
MRGIVPLVLWTIAILVYMAERVESYAVGTFK